MFLVVLVGLDLLVLQPKNSKFTGIGIGLATAIKLTPAVYLIYLVVTKRWRAATGPICAWPAPISGACDSCGARSSTARQSVSCPTRRRAWARRAP